MVMGSIYGNKRTRTHSHQEINFYGDHDKQNNKKKTLGRNFVYHDSDYDRKVKFISRIKTREDLFLKEQHIDVK